MDGGSGTFLSLGANAVYHEVQQRIRNRPRTWLVTGAAGFIGSHLLESLLKLDQRVIGLDNFSLGSRDNLAAVGNAVTENQWRNFRFIEGDIRSPETCRHACRAVNVVLHQAALGSVPRSVADPIGTHDTNITGFLNMLVAAHGAGVSRFVYAGSSAVYGDHHAPLMIEPETGRPLSPYAVTKRVDEIYADVFARCYGFDSIGLRYFNVFGPRQDPNGAYAAVIPTWIVALIRNEPVFINGDGETTRDYCYIDNVVQANLLAAMVEDGTAVNQVYNIALNAKTTLNGLFEMIRSLLVPRFPHVRDLAATHREFRAGDVRASQADIGKAERLLGYRPAWRVKEGLARTINWYVTKLMAPRHAFDEQTEEREAAHHGS
jgi:UDP-N-acetylglucosamine/UDP-N-acetyl-alpha-D-glucosaminouronate 4-epimerase